jgi:phospholipid/cholesterol/gamma-HCH transport system permease protein
VEAIIMAVVLITHSSYGHNASGGPVGVGEAVGPSVRFSPISMVVVPPFAVPAPYGVNPNFALTV